MPAWLDSRLVSTCARLTLSLYTNGDVRFFSSLLLRHFNRFLRTGKFTGRSIFFEVREELHEYLCVEEVLSIHGRNTSLMPSTRREESTKEWCKLRICRKTAVEKLMSVNGKMSSEGLELILHVSHFYKGWSKMIHNGSVSGARKFFDVTNV